MAQKAPRIVVFSHCLESFFEINLFDFASICRDAIFCVSEANDSILEVISED
jgi:hypothetical protein